MFAQAIRFIVLALFSSPLLAQISEPLIIQQKGAELKLTFDIVSRGAQRGPARGA